MTHHVIVAGHEQDSGFYSGRVTPGATAVSLIFFALSSLSLFMHIPTDNDKNVIKKEVKNENTR